ncbi:MAG: hypothetical protein AAGJ40_09100 [Planctomycetota bacterium]
MSTKNGKIRDDLANLAELVAVGYKVRDADKSGANEGSAKWR